MSAESCGARTPEERRELLKIRQGYSLKGKIHLTKERIKEWYEAHDGLVYVAFSGGKDSTVLLDLVWSMYPDVPAVFADTGNELESVKEFVRSYGDKVEWVEPSMSFEEVVERWGYPVVSKKTADYIGRVKRTKNQAVRDRHLIGIKLDGSPAPMYKIANKWQHLVDADFNTTNKCCGILKSRPTDVYKKATGRKQFVGTMADESDSRLMSYINHGGCNAFDQKDPSSRPMMFWLEQDVLTYIKENNVPIAGAYENILEESDGRLRCSGDQRTGCKFCLFGVHLEKGENRIQRLARVEPESYRHCIEDLGYNKVMDMLGVDWKPYEFKTQGDMFDERYEVEADEL